MYTLWSFERDWRYVGEGNLDSQTNIAAPRCIIGSDGTNILCEKNSGEIQGEEKKNAYGIYRSGKGIW